MNVVVVTKRAGERRGEKETERGGAGREGEGEIRWPLPVRAQGSLPEWAEQVLKLFLIYVPPPIPPPKPLGKHTNPRQPDSFFISSCA